MAGQFKFLTAVHPTYEKMKDKWEYARLVYTGEYLDKEHISKFLNKRTIFELDEIYADRKNNADPSLDFPTLIGKLSGQISAVEGDLVREWGDLGDPNDIATIAGKLKEDIDGDGQDYEVLWNTFITRLIYQHWMYILVDGVGVEETQIGERISSEATLKLIFPEMVDNWANDGSWMKVKHAPMVEQDGPTGKPRTMLRYSIYALDGVTTWEREEDKSEDAWITDPTRTMPYQYFARDGETPTLPIYRTKLPFDVFVAYMAARKAMVIFNKESEKDHNLRVALVPERIDESSPNLFQQNEDKRSAGITSLNANPGEKSYYIAPPEGPTQLAIEDIQKKRDQLEKDLYQQFADQSKEKTATQIRFESRASIESFLSLISIMADEAENNALWRLEQVYFPSSKSKWGKANVTRSTNFLPQDPMLLVEKVLEILFGPVEFPVTDDMLEQAIRYIWERGLGFEIGAEDLPKFKAEVKNFLDNRNGPFRGGDDELIVSTGDGSTGGLPDIQPNV